MASLIDSSLLVDVERGRTDLGALLEARGDRGVAMAAAPASGGGAAAAKEEKTTFTVILEGAGDKKIQVIKEVRAITGLGLKEAKDLVDGAPKPIKEGVTKEEAADIKAKVEAAGGKVKLD